MYIKEIIIKNYKCLQDNTVKFRIPDGKTPGSGLNIFVGENNSGKSSLMEAVYFIRNKAKKEVVRIGARADEESCVEQVFVGGDIPDVVSNFVEDGKKKIFLDSLYEEDGKTTFRVRRSFGTTGDIKKILFYNSKDSTFGAPAAIESSFLRFFQISNIWADTSPEDEGKFGSSTVCGSLLADISDKFKIDPTSQYSAFLEIFDKTFNVETSELQKDLSAVAKETEEVLSSQFGDVKLRFNFENPEADLMFKNVKIFVNDGEETELEEKGHGLQRAVILSLLQVYAKRITELESKTGEIVFRPHYLFIDEPELGLHPQAQRKLFDALCSLSATHQIFISTHSENFVSPKIIENIYKFDKQTGKVGICALGEEESLDLSENRKFFLHHHKLFFAKSAIFVEGVSDYERYPLFCQKMGFGELVKDFNLLGSSNNYPMFEKFCKVFGINRSFIFDVDVLSITNPTSKKLPTSAVAKIVALNKSVTKKDPSNLLKENLLVEEQKMKLEIVSDLQKEKIFVLSEGAIEHYLDEDGLVVDGNKEKMKELEGIFSAIMNKN